MYIDQDALANAFANNDSALLRFYFQPWPCYVRMRESWSERNERYIPEQGCEMIKETEESIYTQLKIVLRDALNHDKD